MKIGFRTPSFKKSFKARTTGKLKRKMKKAVNPLYGKAGMGYIKNPKKAAENALYHKTTVGVSDVINGVTRTSNSSKNKTKNGPQMNTVYSNNCNAEKDISVPVKSTRIYQKTWFIITVLVFFAPLGLLLMWKYTGWSKPIKIVLSIIALVFFALVVAETIAESE